MKNLYANEPVAVITAVIALVSAIVALLPMFGVALTAEQIGGIMAVVVALGSVVSTLLVRSQVTPVANPRDNQGERLVPEETYIP
jgi:hypothetical protein